MNKKNNTNDYYKALGVTKNSTKSEIKKAYRKLAMKFHPDKNRNSEEEREEATKQFKKVTEAFNVLNDDKKRKMYDMGGHDAVNGNGGHGHGFGGFGGGGIDISDLLGGMMGGRRR